MSDTTKTLSGAEYSLECGEYARLILDSCPIACNVWDSQLNIIACNKAALMFFDADSEEFCLKFLKFSPKFQPNGRESKKLVQECLNKAIADGESVFSWLHQKKNGEQLPCEITLKKMEYADTFRLFGYMRDLRGEIETNAAIIEAEERNRLVLDSSPLANDVWDDRMNMIDCNAAALKLFGVETKEQYCREWYTHSVPIQPNGRFADELVVEYVAEAMKKGEVTYSWLHQKINGEEIPAQVTLKRVPYKDTYRILGYIRDMRDELAAQHEMRRADERNALMLNATPICFTLWNNELKIVDTNDAALKLFGIDDKQYLINNFLQFSPMYQEDGTLSTKKLKGAFKKALKYGKDVFEWTHQDINGELIPAEVTLVKIDYKNTFRIAGIARDLREHKAMMAEREKAEHQLREAKELAEDSAKTKSEFLTNVSHEIRTPLNVIIGMVEMLLLSNLDKKQRNNVQEIKRASTGLLAIINDILNFSKIDSGKLEVNPIDFDFYDLLSDLDSMFKLSADAKGLKYEQIKSDNLPHYLFGDSDLLRLSLVNVLDNAIKFTDRGTVSFEVSSNDVSIFFDIADSGIGVKPENIQKMFKPFEQIDGKFNRYKEGTGLGLSIAKNIFEHFGGELSLETEYGKGTTFHIIIPLVVGDESAARKNLSETKCISAPTANVLVVDDFDVNLQVASGLLEMFDISCDTASNGQKAIDMMLEKEYDLVFMDHMMPEIDGLETTEQLRGLGFNAEKYPIVALTANVVKGAREFLLANGMNDYMSKPIDKTVLREMLAKWLPSEKIVFTEVNQFDNIGTDGEDVTAAICIDGLSVENGVANLGGNKKNYMRTLALFHKDGCQKLIDLTYCLEKEQISLYTTFVHGLKSALATIGNSELSAKAAKLESAGLDNNLEYIKANHNEFLESLKLFLNELSAHVAPKSNGAASTEDAAKLIEVLPKLEKALEDMSISEIDTCNRIIHSLSVAGDVKTKLDEISELILTMDYDKAVEVIRSMMI